MPSSEILKPELHGFGNRVPSIDIVRGAIMIIMALDHVRDFFHITAFSADPLDPRNSYAALFFTRWITHLCAPSFLLLSGISSYLSGQRQSTKEKSTFLIKRGIWLIFAEVVFVTLILSFDITYRTIFLQVIWALGWSMIILGLLIRYASSKTILLFGLVLVFGHNALDFIKLSPDSPLGVLLNVFFTSSGKLYPRGDGGSIAVFYAILPWTGIMLAGYGIGQLYETRVSVKRRKKILLWTGIGSIVLFAILRFANGYGDPVKWSAQDVGWRTFLSFMNASKYPPSLLFTLMTTGFTLMMLSFADQCVNKAGAFVSVYGKVPFFYFIVHFLVIHTLSAFTVLASGYTLEQAMDPSLIFKFRPFDFGFELWYVYLIWIAIVLLMYWPSKWFASYKSTHKNWWLSYL